MVQLHVVVEFVWKCIIREIPAIVCIYVLLQAPAHESLNVLIAQFLDLGTVKTSSAIAPLVLSRLSIETALD